MGSSYYTPGFTPTSNLVGAQTGTLSNVAQSLSSKLVVGSSSARNGIFFFNDTGNGNCLISFDVTASLSHFSFKLAPSASLVLAPAPVYCGPISCTWDQSGAGNLRVTETS